MSYKFNNNKFAYSTFDEEIKEFNAPVHILTYQSPEVKEILKNDGYYKPNLEFSREVNDSWYKSVVNKYGYLPIWCFNPLQFGDVPSGTWNPTWFDDGSLWRRFLEVGGLTEEIINSRLLYEFVVPATELKKDITLDYGFISVIKEVTYEQLVGTYQMVYDVKQETEDWFYPTMYPSADNKWNATFKKISNFKVD